MNKQDNPIVELRVQKNVLDTIVFLLTKVPDVGVTDVAGNELPASTIMVQKGMIVQLLESATIVPEPKVEEPAATPSKSSKASKTKK